MGRHAFAAPPRQAVRLKSHHPEMASRGVFGVEQRWDMPVTLWRAVRGFDIRYPGNDHYTLSFIVGGASVERRDGRFAGRCGYADADSFMLYAGGGSRRYASRGDVRLCQTYFQTSLIQDIAARDCDLPAGGLELRDDRIFARDLGLRRLVEQYLSRASDAGLPPSQLEMDARATLIGLHLIRHHSNRAVPAPRAVGSLSPRRLATVVDYVEAHLVERVSLAELAAAVGLSQHHFCHAFRRSTGMTPHRYLTARRLERSRGLLAGSSSLAEIALDCGFGSQQHFTTVFRQVLGTTPGAMRAASRCATGAGSVRSCKTRD